MRRAILAVVIVLWAVSADAAVVFMKDGGRLEGTVLRRSDGELVLQTASGVVRIPADKIQSVESAPAPAPPPPPLPTFPPASAPRRLSDDELFGPSRQMFSLAFGLAAPLSSVDFSAIGGGSMRNGDVGPLLGLQYLRSLSPRLAVGGEFQYAARSEAFSQGLLTNSQTGVFGDTVLFLGELKYSLSARRGTRPYVLVGAGPGFNSTVIDARPNFGFVWSDTGTDERRRLIDGSAWGLAATARLGVDFDVSPSNVFSLEGGWTGLTGERYGATAQGQALGLSGVAAPLSYFTLAARFGWRF